MPRIRQLQLKWLFAVILRLYRRTFIVLIMKQSMAFKLLVVISILIAPAFFGDRSEAYQVKKYYITKIKQTSVMYRVITIDVIKEDSVELPLSSNLVIPSKYYGISEPLNLEGDLNFLSLELLRRGYALLDKSKSVPSEFVEAENYAKTQKNGVWSETSQPVIGNSEKTIKSEGWLDNIILLFKNGWKYVALIFGSSIVLFFFRDFIRHLIKKFLYERKVELIFIGVKGSGKTGLFMRFLEPTASKHQITSLTPSQAFNLKKTRRVISVGKKFEILPSFHDTPGEELAKVHDLLLSERKYAIIVVLSPTGKPTVSNKMDLFTAPYITEQLHYCKYFVSTILQSTKMKNKPKFLVVFMSKFDLLSENPPNIKASEAETNRYLIEFREHIALIENSAKIRQIFMRTIIGSAAEPEWKTAQSILDDSLIDKL